MKQAHRRNVVTSVVARQGQEADTFNGNSYVKTLLGRRIQQFIVWLLFNDDSSAAEVVWRRGSISKLGEARDVPCGRGEKMNHIGLASI
jgi:hypothetical protein